MKIRCNFKTDMNSKAKSSIEAAAVRSIEKAGEALKTEIIQSQVVPRAQGTLQNEGFFIDNSKAKSGSVSLVFSTPYARRLYYHPEYNFSKIENQNAQGKWLEPWINGKEKDRAAELFTIFMRKEVR